MEGYFFALHLTKTKVKPPQKTPRTDLHHYIKGESSSFIITSFVFSQVANSPSTYATMQASTDKPHPINLSTNSWGLTTPNILKGRGQKESEDKLLKVPD
jgi:hypothetical protein